MLRKGVTRQNTNFSKNCCLIEGCSLGLTGVTLVYPSQQCRFKVMNDFKWFIDREGSTEEPVSQTLVSKTLVRIPQILVRISQTLVRISQTLVRISQTLVKSSQTTKCLGKSYRSINPIMKNGGAFWTFPVSTLIGKS